MSRTSGFVYSRCIRSSVYHQCTWAVKHVVSSVFVGSILHVGCSSWTNESSFYLDRFSGVEGRMLWETWRVSVSVVESSWNFLLVIAFGTASFRPTWALVKTVSSPLDLEKWSSQKNVLHVIVNACMARVSHHCWYSCHPNLMEEQMWNRYLRDASESCTNRAYFWIAVLWLQSTGRGWEWGIPHGVSNFHWEKKQRKYLKKPVWPMLASITINCYLRVIVFSKYSSKNPQSEWERFCGSHLQERGNAFQRTIGKQWKNISFCLAVFLENAGFVGEDIAGMTLAVGLNMFKDLTHCILWKNCVCVHVCTDVIYVLGV